MKFYNLDETADILHTNRRKINELIKTGELQAFRIGVNYLIDPNDITLFVAAQKQKLIDEQKKRAQTQTEQPTQSIQPLQESQQVTLFLPKKESLCKV